MKTPRRNVGLFCFLALGLIVAALGSLQWQVERHLVERKLKAALQKETAYTLSSFGTVHFQAFPWPRLTIQELRLTKETPSQERVSVENVRVRLNLASWLWGNPRIVEMRVTKPVVHFTTSEKLNETEALSTTVLHFLRSDRRPDLRMLRINDAQLFVDGKLWVEQLFINVQNVASSDLRLRARGRYSDIPINFRAEIAQGTSPEGRGVHWNIRLPGVSTSFEGRLFGSRSLDADGISKTNVTDGEEYARGLGLSPSVARIMSKFAISGATRFTWPLVQIRNATVQFDENKLDGSVEISLDSKPRITATLGADVIDLNPRLTAWTNDLPDQAQNWPQQPIALDWLNIGQADIRLSAERLLIGKAALEKVALASQLREGRLDVVLSEAVLKSGTLRGRTQIRRMEKELVARTSLQFEQIDIEAAQELIGISRMKGIASGQIAIDVKGATTAQLMKGNSGKGNILIRNGEFIGLDVERLLTRLDKTTQPIVAASGSTRFRTMSSDFSVAAGVVSLANSSFSTLGLTAPIDGTIDINQQAFDLKLKLQPLIIIQRLSGAAIKITGPWSRPIFTPDMPQ